MLRHFKKEMRKAQLIKFGPDSYLDGETAPGIAAPPQDIKIIVPQPAKANDLKQLQEGEKLSDFLRTYAHKKYEIMPRVGDVASDQILWDGQTYTVTQVARRRELGNFHRIIMRNRGGE